MFDVQLGEIGKSLKERARMRFLFLTGCEGGCNLWNGNSFIEEKKFIAPYCFRRVFLSGLTIIER